MSKDTYISNLLGTFSTTIATRIEQEVAELGGRSLSHESALVTIRNHPNDSIDILSKALGLSHSGGVRLINTLENEQLVVRQRSGDDARSVVIRLTTMGRKRADKVLQARAHVTNNVLGTLSKEQRDALTPILEVVLNSLTHGTDSARRNCRLCDERVCRPKGCPVESATDGVDQN